MQLLLSFSSSLSLSSFSHSHCLPHFFAMSAARASKRASARALAGGWGIVDGCEKQLCIESGTVWNMHAGEVRLQLCDASPADAERAIGANRVRSICYWKT